MCGWKTYLNGYPLDWLLEGDNPSIRYLTLTALMDKTENNADVKLTRSNIMKMGPVHKILKLQDEDGFWDKKDSFYTAKYKGTVWQLMILAELRAIETDPRIRKTCEFLLERSQDNNSGGFSMAFGKKLISGLPSQVIPCLTGNMVWSLLKMGYIGDPRLQAGIDWLTDFQRFDDGDSYPPHGWRYEHHDGCFGKHSCHMGVVKCLKALAQIPEEQRTDQVQSKIEEAGEYLLKHRIFKRSHDLEKVAKPGWKRFGFPLMYQTDVLEIMEILTKLGVRDDRMEEAMDLILKKQDDEGKWIMENSFNGKYHIDIEKKGEKSKWITLKALCVINKYFS